MCLHNWTFCTISCFQNLEVLEEILKFYIFRHIYLDFPPLLLKTTTRKKRHFNNFSYFCFAFSLIYIFHLHLRKNTNIYLLKNMNMTLIWHVVKVFCIGEFVAFLVCFYCCVRWIIMYLPHWVVAFPIKIGKCDACGVNGQPAQLLYWFCFFCKQTFSWLLQLRIFFVNSVNLR